MMETHIIKLKNGRIGLGGIDEEAAKTWWVNAMGLYLDNLKEEEIDQVKPLSNVFTDSESL
jgi:hypothetical protein